MNLYFNLKFNYNHTRSLNRNLSTLTFSEKYNKKEEYINPNPNPQNKLENPTYLREKRNKKTRKRLKNLQSFKAHKVVVFFFLSKRYKVE